MHASASRTSKSPSSGLSTNPKGKKVGAISQATPTCGSAKSRSRPQRLVKIADAPGSCSNIVSPTGKNPGAGDRAAGVGELLDGLD